MYVGKINPGCTLLSTCGSNKNQKYVQTHVSYIQSYHQGHNVYKSITCVDLVYHVRLERIRQSPVTKNALTRLKTGVGCNKLRR